MSMRETDWDVYLRTTPRTSYTQPKASEHPSDVTVSSGGPESIDSRTASTPKSSDQGILGGIGDFLSGIKDYFLGEYYHLPISAVYPYVPAIPVSIEETVSTLGRLLVRLFQIKQPMQSLTNRYTIGETTAYGYEWLFNKTTKTKRVENLSDLKSMIGPNSAREFAAGFFDLAKHSVESQSESDYIGSYTLTSLEKSSDWTMSWTTLPEVYQNAVARGLDKTYAEAIENADSATNQFWPMLAEHGLAYNLLILEKVDPSRLDRVMEKFAGIWAEKLTKAYEHGRLYLIDLEWFNTLEPQEAGGGTRFTPGAMVLLIQDDVKDLAPVAVRLSTAAGDVAQLYGRLDEPGNDATDSAWIYSLLAAKTAISVWGIWLGHVYHFHIVTAAMQMTMYNVLHRHTSNPIYQILKPQSDFLIGFDNVLFLAWGSIAPPTSIISSQQFLSLINTYAENRNFFDDDPKVTLAKNGIVEADFSVAKPWDKYQIVGHYLHVWDAVESYIHKLIAVFYPTDESVEKDELLQKWIHESSSAGEGNVRGLTESMKTPTDVASVLTSLIYRITAHGTGRLNSVANPFLSFVANMPPCLQKSDFPSPTAHIETKELFTYLPMTGTIGDMLNFLFIFSYSTPYESFVPLDGIESSLFYENDTCNAALVEFRHKILETLHDIQPEQPQVFQWPLNIET